jgi:3-hydroxyacyl-[acyl-carrier-protein] dehydratase
MVPTDVLPHRPPFLFVDEVLDVVPGQFARGRWHLTGEEAFFAGHFPCQPTLPGVLMVEAIAQLGGIALLSHDDYRGKLPLFAGIDKARFRRQVGPGETLDLEVRLHHMGSSAGRGSGQAFVDEALACQADMLFVLAEYEGTCE